MTPQGLCCSVPLFPLKKPDFDLDKEILSLLRDSVTDIKDTFPIKTAIEPELDIPKERSFGDLSTNAAMKIGREAKHPAKEVAAFLVERIKTRIKKSHLSDYIERVEIKGPGFINIYLRNKSLYYVLDEILKEKSAYGRNKQGKGKTLQIEFVSANPTGPLTVAHGRQAAFGDSLANVLTFSGYRVTREYYINDEGRQINLLGESIKAKYLKSLGRDYPDPQEGYKGEYITDLALGLKEKYGNKKENAPLNFFADFGRSTLLSSVKKDLEAFGVKFDMWSSQRRLREKGTTQKALDIIRKKGYLYENEGALWFKATSLGDEKDRVVTKSDGSFTYLAPDIGYHLDKFRRKFDHIINIWGPDHHGYIPRIKAACQALGYERERLNCLLVQLVTLYEGKEVMRISTRAGKFITLNDVVDQVGKDVARFFFLMRKRDSHLNFDMALAKKESMDNPVYYIQYAHARISRIWDFYKSEKRKGSESPPDKSLLKKDEEFDMLRVLREFPLAIHSCAEKLETYPLLSYLQELARGFHSFYNKYRVVTDDLELTKTRMSLMHCVKIVLATGLNLLGVSAPTKM